MRVYQEQEYNAEQHDKFRALGLPAHIAERLTSIEYIIDGEPQAQCSVTFEAEDTEYRGDVLICAIPGRREGYICGLAELYEVRPARLLTATERLDVVIPKDIESSRSYAFFFRNPRRVIEMPCEIKRGLHSLIIDKDQITEYPVNVVIGGEEWKKIRAKYGI